MVNRLEKPLIGVTISRHKSKIACFFDWFSIRRHGGRVVFLAPGDKVDVSVLDGLLIGGGDDISADIYGGDVSPSIRLDPERDALELSLLRYAVDAELPVLGICRGAQMINVFFGGTLYSDIRGMPREKTTMRTILAKKIVRLTQGTQTSNIIGREEIRVNSLHHQAVETLGSGLIVAGRDRGDFVQALEHKSLPFLIGVQWHPEFLVFSKENRDLFCSFLKAVKSRRNKHDKQLMG